MVQTLKEIYEFISQEVVKDFEETVRTGEQYNDDAKSFQNATEEIANTANTLLTSMDSMVNTMNMMSDASGQSAQDTSEISSNITRIMEYFDEISGLSEDLTQETETLRNLVTKYTV